MKKFALCLLLSLCSLPVLAGVQTFQIQAQAAMSHAAPRLLLAASGSVQGANGTFFHSDITVLNYRGQSQRVGFIWLPAGQSTTGEPTFIDIPANSGIVAEDFVASVLGKSGLGALLIAGYDTAQDFADPGALLYATERVWTPQPGTNGTTSQSFPAIATSDINLIGGTILGQRQDTRYRTNVGIVNIDIVQYQFEVDQTTDDPTQLVSFLVTVPAMSMMQVPLPVSHASALQIYVRPVNSATNPRGWMTYASSVDNVTGDSWSSLALQVR